MEFHVLTLEVDGTLRNPVVVAAVLAWGTVLSAATYFLVAWGHRSEPEAGLTPRARRLAAGLAVLLLFAATPVAQGLIGSLLYQLGSIRSGGPLASVGFWGGPPVLPSWIAAGLCGLLAALRGRPGRALAAAGALLLLALLAVYAAAKVHFYTRFDPRDPAGYVSEHWPYWAGLASIAGLLWLTGRLAEKGEPEDARRTRDEGGDPWHP